MEEVLGYESEPASPEEALQAAEEMRLLRLQTEVLIKELRSLRQALHESGEGASVAEMSPPEVKAPAPAPAAPAPQAPRGLRQTGFPPVPSSPVPEPIRSRGEAFEQKSPAPPPPAVAGPGATVQLVSAGFETGNAADFIVDGTRIELSGEWGRRGINAIAIDPGTGQVLSRKVYDIWGNPALENAQLAADLNGLSDGVVVLIALKDSGMENLDMATIRALQDVGSTIDAPLGVREGYVLVGSKGGEAIAESRGPKVEVEAVLPCAVVPPSGPPPAVAKKAPPAPFAAPAQPGGPPQAPPSPFAAPAQPFAAPQAQPSPFAAPSQPAAAQAAPPPPFAAPAQRAPAQQAPLPPFPVAAEAQAPPRPQSPLPPFPVAPEPQAGVTFNEAVAEQAAEEEGEGESWQEVVLMLEKLQEKIQAKRLAGERPSS